VLEQQLIAQVLIGQAAAREGITVSDEQVQKAIQDIEEQAGGKDALDAFLADQGMTRDDLVKQQRDRLVTEALQDRVIAPLGDSTDQVHARHLLVASKEEAEKALARIKAGEDFTRVANEVSQDAATNTLGGDLGWFPRGIMLPEIDTIAFSLPPGGLSDVFQSSLGWHVLQVVEHNPQRPLTDEQKQALRQKAFEDWLNAERARANVEIFVK
jgi:parvulin-like peptidyl-prolyl isomerase